MYRILQEEGIDLPRYAVLNRDPDKPDGQSKLFKSLIFLKKLYFLSIQSFFFFS